MIGIPEMWSQVIKCIGLKKTKLLAFSGNSSKYIIQQILWTKWEKKLQIPCYLVFKGAYYEFEAILFPPWVVLKLVALHQIFPIYLVF